MCYLLTQEQGAILLYEEDGCAAQQPSNCDGADSIIDWIACQVHHAC